MSASEARNSMRTSVWIVGILHRQLTTVDIRAMGPCRRNTALGDVFTRSALLVHSHLLSLHFQVASGCTNSMFNQLAFWSLIPHLARPPFSLTNSKRMECAASPVSCESVICSYFFISRQHLDWQITVCLDIPFASLLANKNGKAI